MEIKFRSWDEEQSRMYYFSLHDYMITSEACQDDLCSIAAMKNIKQFTGLKDKNEVDIYEGDIVEIIHPCWTATCETIFIDGAYFFVEKDNPVNNAQIRADKFLKEKWKIKVIGNIHQNPELIENETN